MTQTYYQFEIYDGEDWKRVGTRYASKEVAKTWRSFVKSAWCAKHIRLATVKAPAPAKAERSDNDHA